MVAVSRKTPGIRRVCILLVAALLFFALGSSNAPAESADEPHILLLYAYGYGGRGVELFSEGFFKAITEAGFSVSNVYAEYLDLQRNRELPDYRRNLRKTLENKYGRRRIDLIVTVQQPALAFLLTEGRDIAPDAAVITLQHRPLLEEEKAGRRIVGEVNQFDIKGTLERAIELFPKTRQVLFASGSSEADVTLAEQAAAVALPYREHLEFKYTTGMTLDEILLQVANLPPQSIIIFTQYNRDSKGRVALAYEAEKMIIKAANAPVFGFYDYNLKNGGIGGSVIAVEASGSRTGKLAIELLQGLPPTAAGTLRMNENIPMFDWQQIRRFGGDPSRLPEGTIFLNRPPSAWQQYGGIIVGTLIFILSQSLLIVALLVNIRRRKRVESVLSKSEAEFHAIFEGMFDSVIFADLDRHIRLVNTAFSQMFGYRAEEAIGRTTEFLYTDPADYLDQGRRRFHGGPEIEGGSYELQYRRKDGSLFWAESNGTRVVGPGGAVLGIMSMQRDITEKRANEEEKIKFEAQLHQLQKMEAIGQLAGGVAHDFNNMLGVILGHTELAMDQMDPASPLLADLEEIRKAALRSADITRQLLAFARKQTVQPQVLDLNETVEGMLKMLRRLIGEAIQLVWSPGADLWPVRVDPSQIDQILANLCVNARDAITDIGKITVETANCAFEVEDCNENTVHFPGEYVRIAVSDNGCGMEKDLLLHIFEPFFTTKGVGEGTGLGLATVYGAVQQNHGFINAYSEPGQGTTFSIYLPRHMSTAAQVPVQSPPEPAARGHETILLVEDEPAILGMIRAILQGLGYAVLPANSPGEALALVEQFAGDIHLLLTDVIMPEMNGHTLAEQILTSRPTMKCLFMSGYPANVIAYQGVLDDGICFIHKPFAKKELAAKIRQVLAA